MPLRVGVDATSWTNRRGYGRFARSALSGLLALDETSEYVFLLDAQTARTASLPARAEPCVVPLRRVPAEAASASSQRPLADLARLSLAASRGHFDVVLFPSVYTWFPVVRTPTVVGIHDLIAEELPELTFPRRGARMRWRLKRSTAVRTARRIFTVSEASRALIATRLGFPLDEIAVVPGAPDEVFRPRPGSEVDRILAPLELGNGASFFVYSGGVSPHKRLDTLLDAYASFVARIVPAPKLVVTGALEDEAYLSAANAVRAQVTALGLGRHVVLAGHVPDETLACLYAGAIAFVSPSASEGYGLPAVEAAASKTTLVLSDIAAHRESIGEAALYFPVGDSGALAEQLIRAIGDSGLRERLEEAAARRVEGLTWDVAGRRLRALLREAVDG